MQLVVGLGPGVLLGDVRTKLEMGADGLSERLVAGKVSFVDRFEIQGNKLLPLLVGDG